MENTFGKIADKWLKSRAGSLSPVTRERYEILLKKHILPVFASRPAEEITRREFKDFLSKISMKESVASSILSVMQSVLRFAADEMDLNTCDIGGMKIPKEEKCPCVFTLEEQRCLEKRLLKGPSCANLGILLSLYTDLKLGEICALKWGDVSESKKIFHVHATVCRMKDAERGRSVSVVRSQRCAPRDIPFPNKIFKMYSERGLEKGDFLLTGTGKLMDPRTLQYRFRTVLSECGIENAPFMALKNTSVEKQ